MFSDQARLVVVGVLLVIGSSSAATFHALGPVDETININGISRQVLPVVSGDGRVVGASSGQVGFTWTPTGGKVALPAPWNSCPTALSYDGSVVAGISTKSDGHWYPTRWAGGNSSILEMDSAPRGIPTDISADGSVIVGHNGANTGGFKWTQNAAWDITQLSKVVGVSGDGSILAGNKYGTMQLPGDWGPGGRTIPTSYAYTWDNWNQVDIGNLNGTPGTAWAGGISADGRVVVGGATTTMSREPFRWTAEGGMVALGSAPGWGGADILSMMMAASGDGSVLVGYAMKTVNGAAPEQQAIIWDAAHGVRLLQDALVSDYGLDLTGWHLDEATGISDDGMTIVGYGTGSVGKSEGWVVRLPEPASLLLLVPGLLVVARRRPAR